MNNDERIKFKKDVEDVIREVVPKYLQQSAFQDRKLTDTPLDAFQVVSRQYVTLHGPSSSRPTSSVIGQFYLDMTLASGRGKPVWWNGTGFVDATGTYV